MPDPDPNTPTPPAGGTPPAGTPPAGQTPPNGQTPPAKGGEDAVALKARLEAAEAEAARGRAAQAELDRIKAENEAAEKKRMEEQGQWKELAEKRAADAASLQKRILTERVRATALSQGLIDDSLVTMIPTDDSFLVNGEPDQAKIDKAIADFKGAKAHFFKAAAATTTGAGGAPPPDNSGQPKYDFRKASSKAEVDALYERAKRELRR